jgi:aspartyl-tRNA synthetase
MGIEQETVQLVPSDVQAAPPAHRYRTHTCNDLRMSDVGKRVRLSGWIARRRDHGGLLFFDLRDNYGITQVLIQAGSSISEAAAKLSKETVVRVDGIVSKRPDEMRNANIATGEIEIIADEIEVLGPAQPLPFQVMEDTGAPEEMRLTYRYLDLRREKLHQNILMRARVISSLRRRMTEEGFTEFQTPILTSSSPEGARDYLVPSRRHPGKFYALPQAPQQFKQLLMVSGFDRYFQIAPCFRDEDARADRSPGEFYQLDMEMSFATQDDVFAVVERVLTGVFNEFGNRPEVHPPFPRLSYADTMAKYGTDKPDLRIPTVIHDVTDIFAGSQFAAFTARQVRALPVPGGAAQSRSWYDKLTDLAKQMGATVFTWVTIGTDGAIKGPIAKFLTEDEVGRLKTQLKVAEGDSVIMMGDVSVDLLGSVMGRLRVRIAEMLDQIDDTRYNFCWITDFPMFEKNPDTGQIEFSHNPFSMPQGGMEALLTQDPLTIKAFQYDIVCNGYELSSGAVRNHDPETMYKAFEIAGYDRSVVDRKFPALQQAFRYGAPPHAGIAPGVDRIVMLITGERNIREVITFPMNQQAQDLLMGAPSGVTPQQLKDVHIQIAMPKT